MTIKFKTALDHTLESMKLELQFAKLEIFKTKDRIEDLIQQKDFLSYHSKEEVEISYNKLKELEEILQKIQSFESDIKYFKNKALLQYKELKTKSSP